MPNIHKNTVSVSLATYLAERLCPGMSGLLQFVRYGAADDSVAFLNSGPGQYFFKDLTIDILNKERLPIDKDSLKKLGSEALLAIGGDEPDWHGRTVKNMLEKIFQQIMIEELADQLAKDRSDRILVAL